MKIVTKVGAVAVLGCVLSGAINGPTAVAQATAAPSISSTNGLWHDTLSFDHPLDRHGKS
jgi:hypothetical protein